MIRASLAADSPQAMTCWSVQQGTRVPAPHRGRRTVDESAGWCPRVSAYYVRLDRAGHTIAAYQSADGSHWTLVGTDTLSMGSSAYVGLAISSHTTSSAATARLITSQCSRDPSPVEELRSGSALTPRTAPRNPTAAEPS